MIVGSLLPVLRAFAQPTHSILNCSGLPTTSHIDATFSRSRNIDPAAQAIRQLSICRDQGGELSAQCRNLIGAGIIGPCLKVARRRNACSRTGWAFKATSSMQRRRRSRSEQFILVEGEAIVIFAKNIIPLFECGQYMFKGVNDVEIDNCLPWYALAIKRTGPIHELKLLLKCWFAAFSLTKKQ